MVCTDMYRRNGVRGRMCYFVSKKKCFQIKKMQFWVTKNENDK